MTAPTLANLARMSTATTGTGTITLGSAVSGFLSFAGAGITNGQTVSYAISDGANSEAGRGVYTSSGTTLTRTVSKSTNSNAAISLSGTAQVFITALAEDIRNGEYTKISTTSLGTGNSLAITSIPQTYGNLYIDLGSVVATNPIEIQVSENNGSTWDTGSAATVDATGGAAFIPNYSGDSREAIVLTAYNSSYGYPAAILKTTAAGINAVRIIVQSSGTFSSGNVGLYGQ